jgi:hypothetical protein
MEGECKAGGSAGCASGEVRVGWLLFDGAVSPEQLHRACCGGQAPEAAAALLHLPSPAAYLVAAAAVGSPRGGLGRVMTEEAAVAAAAARMAQSYLRDGVGRAGAEAEAGATAMAVGLCNKPNGSPMQLFHQQV